MGEPRKAQSLFGPPELCQVCCNQYPITSTTKGLLLQERHWIIEGGSEHKCRIPKNMPSRKKRSKGHDQSQWSEWVWSEQYQRYYRYRKNGEGNWEWEYDQPDQPAQEQCPAIGSPSSSEEPETWQSYNQLENEGVERTELEGDSSTYQKEVHGKDHSVAPQSQQRTIKMGIDATRDNFSLYWKKARALANVAEFSVPISGVFRFGVIFKVLWPEPIGSGGPEITVPTMRRSKKGSKAGKHCGASERATKLEPTHHVRSDLDIASRFNYAKIYTVEHKVFFIGQVDQRNMESLQSGDTGWMRSDTGEDIPVIMDEQPQPCPSSDCHGNRFQLPCRCAVPSTMIPSVALPSGLLMSSSFLWLNQRMELCEPSATMGNIINLARVAIPKSIPKAMLGIPNGILFVFFLVGTAGLTGATIASVTHRDTSANIFALQLVLALAGLIASGMVGFSLEEIVLFCLPIIIGCSTLSSSVAGRKQVAQVHQEKVILSEV